MDRFQMQPPPAPPPPPTPPVPPPGGAVLPPPTQNRMPPPAVSPAPPTGAPAPQGPGARFSQAAGSSEGADQAVRAVVLDARANGDKNQAAVRTRARDAWVGGVADAAVRLEDPQQPPTTPGDKNLQLLYDRLRQRGLDPFLASAAAHKALSQIAQQQQQPGGQPPPGGR